MNRLLTTILNLALVMALGVSLSGCVTTRLPIAAISPWEAQNLDTEANPLDVAFTDGETRRALSTCVLKLDPCAGTQGGGPKSAHNGEPRAQACSRVSALRP